MKKHTIILFFSFIVFFLVILYIYSVQPTEPITIKEDRYVVVLSLDGFRSDYPSMAYTPTLDSLTKVGIRSAFRPSYPSNTFPNHYSMATGLYPDHHGIINNNFYANDIKQVYSYKDRQSVTNPLFYEGEPIWNTAQKQGVNTATFFWVGSELAIQGVQPSIWKPYDKSISYKERVDSVISWLQFPQKTRPQLIMWYIEEPDAIGHSTTPESLATKEKIEELDQVINYFFTKARQLDIFHLIDFIILSDHGMATYLPEKYINLNDYLPRDSFHFIFEGAPTILYPKESYIEKAMEILNTIPHISAYKKEEIPSKYNFGTHPRIGNIVVIPEIGTMVHFRSESASAYGATHGYDNFSPEMEAIFYATGPSFKRDTTLPAINNTNLYLLIAHLLDIKPAPNDGEEEIVKQLLK